MRLYGSTEKTSKPRCTVTMKVGWKPDIRLRCDANTVSIPQECKVVIGSGDTQTRHVLFAALSDDEYRLFPAKNGCDLLEVLADMLVNGQGPEWPDLIIVDHDLIGRGGFDLLADLRYVGQSIPFIITVSKGMVLDWKYLQDDTPLIVIEKPLKVEDVRLAVDALFRPASETRPTIPESTSRTSDTTDRRRARRVPVRLWVTEFGENQHHLQLCTNLSMAGIFLNKTIHPHKGQIAKRQFILPVPLGSVVVKSEVVRVIHGMKPGFGIRFVDLASRERTRLNAFVRHVFDKKEEIPFNLAPQY